ncbi:LacI family DNA-binding transcriptional regulator [Olsenella profusa]|uniref:LacI family DNA-binding transcriptional regulator n=1 Tax=Olsenella profusa TaxID=138595 RepID=A0ABS2F3K2_9ACTN|nr:LacI family DNA-binding transcriptional regulator [Olsenella profusa]MBM6775133.1 LacI family DNA-binding transcriptional regulator [Olsenella profusa]
MDINQIAQMAGVSRATVSRYLNDGYVSQEKRDAIRRVIEQTGYVPSRQAKTLRTGKSDVVGVVIPKINSASVSRMVAGITGVLNQAGYQVLLANTDNDAAREVEFLRLFAEKSRVDGVILVATVVTPEHEAAFSALGVPLVVLDQNVAGRTCVYQDDFDAVRDVTALALRGSSRPAYIGVLEEDVSAGRMRREGFLAGCAAAGVTVADDMTRVAEFTVDSGYEQAESLLDAHPDLDAIVCATDSIAYGALTCLREYGRRVPEDVAVTGVGDAELSQIVTPTLTTVHHHYKTSGVEAARMLVGMMAGDDSVPRELKMGYDVVARNSTR